MLPAPELSACNIITREWILCLLHTEIECIPNWHYHTRGKISRFFHHLLHSCSCLPPTSYRVFNYMYYDIIDTNTISLPFVYIIYDGCLMIDTYSNKSQEIIGYYPPPPQQTLTRSRSTWNGWKSLKLSDEMYVWMWKHLNLLRCHAGIYIRMEYSFINTPLAALQTLFFNPSKPICRPHIHSATNTVSTSSWELCLSDCIYVSLSV